MEDAKYVLSAVLGILVIFGIPGYIWYRVSRKGKRAERDRLAALRSLAERFGAHWTTDPARSGPGSVERRRPLAELYAPETVRAAIVGPKKPPTFGFAMDLRRGRRGFRISEAWAYVQGVHVPERVYEYTIETEIGPAPGLKIARVLPPQRRRTAGLNVEFEDLRQTAFDAEVRRPAAGGQWESFPLPGKEFTVYTSDKEFAGRVLTPDTLDWLERNRDRLEFVIGLEHGWCYAVNREKVTPDALLGEVDLLGELLDRIGVPAAT